MSMFDELKKLIGAKTLMSQYDLSGVLWYNSCFSAVTSWLKAIEFVKYVRAWLNDLLYK